ncbi:MAG: SRPBCC domain-containing protein [Gaiellales bacterium]
MPVTSIEKDTEALTLTVKAEFDAPAERVWQIWADPRQLERWWGPPMYPATVVDHELRPGGVVTYFMTSPEGERHHGWWRIDAVDEPRRLEIVDGFGVSPEEAATGLPQSSMVVTLAERAGGGTAMTIESTFPSAEAMQTVIEMGLEEGLKAAMGQIDAILAD